MRYEVSQLAKQATAEWKMKLWLGALLFVAMCTAYFVVGHVPYRAVTALAPTAIDRAIPFSVKWTTVYISLYLLLPFAWLIPTRAMLWRYAGGMVLMCVIACTTFILIPITGPRPPDAPGDAMYALVTYLDNPLNCLPSLHVSLAVYTVLFVARGISERLRAPLTTLLSIWSLLIIYSTLATKQHYFADVVAGAILGWLAFIIATRVRFDRAARPARAPAEGRA
ncbi:MAG TPA: phosphatase PAP2 family protein [Tepidisphaeraceae bacterium]|jgi:membrane-associated phospholipid phosphatase|nr:phosphatase PAP2 family protein [Tepidisphaeraceae bacterium]